MSFYVDVQGVALRTGNVLVPTESRPPDIEPRAHTPKHLADKVLQSKSALEGERKQVTVLFADVQGSMDLAEQLDAEEWRAIMQRFFAILSEGVGEARTRFDVARSRGLSRFVGRDADLRALSDALEQAVGGNGQAIGIVADAGTGKSRLCFEFLEHCRERGMRVFEGRAVAHGRNIPFLPILEIFRSCFGITGDDDNDAARVKIAGHLTVLGTEAVESLALVYDFLGVADPRNPTPRVEPEIRQWQLVGVMRRIITSASRERPSVTMIEDLNWLDPASAEFLEHMVDAWADTHSLLLLNFRPEYRAEWTQKSWYRQIPLTPLDENAVHEERSRVGHVPLAARRAKSPALTTERDEPLVLASGTAHAHEPAIENSPLQVSRELAGDERGHLAAGALRLRYEHAELVRDDAVQHRVFGNSPGVSGAPRVCRHLCLRRRLHGRRRDRRRPRWSMTSATSCCPSLTPPGSLLAPAAWY